jgi:L-rhamnose isomerase/sugar isomerase
MTTENKGVPMTMQITPERIVDEEAALVSAHERDLDTTRERLNRSGVDVDAVIDEVVRFSVAAPSWAVGTGGTRFGRFPIGGEPRTTEEKIDDIAALNSVTGANRTVSLHVPWDDPADPVALREHAAAVGISFDAMNSNTFQDNPATTGDGAVSYKFGSFANADADVRKRALEHNRAVIELGVELGATAITVWLADGTNHPGQANFRRQFERAAECLRELHQSLPDDWEMYTEHKPYEPAFYSSVNSDWGSSLLLAQHAGPRAKCLVDLGHHLPNANIEQVVSRLAMTGRLGGFHFNDSKYGDDDLTVGSIHPYQFFLVVLELLDAGGGALPPVRYMIDASHNLKDPLEDLIQATDQIQVTLAQALLVDRDALADAQDGNDPARAAEVLQAAYRSDVRPLVAEARCRNGAALAPLVTYRRLGYRAAALASRGEDSVASGL